MIKFEKIGAKELKRKLKIKKLSGLALDIDDTLSYTDRYYFEAMTKLINPENLTADALAKKYKRFSRVPYWQSKDARKIEMEFMHSGDFHADIPLIKDASRVIQKIHAIVPIAAYITARPGSTYAGTKKWLARHGFPNAPIVFRSPRAKHSGRHSWKAGVLQLLYPEVLGIVDDHPKLKRELREIKYKGKLFLYNNGKNQKTYHHRLIHFTSWPEILKEIKKKIPRQITEDFQKTIRTLSFRILPK